MSSEGEKSMHEHPVWKFAVKVDERCPTYFTGATALWFLEWKTSNRKPDWTPAAFQMGVYGNDAEEMAAFAFAAASSYGMQENECTMYVRMFKMDEFVLWFAIKADPMDVMKNFTISWAQLVMFVKDERIIETDARISSVQSGIGSWFPPGHWSRRKLTKAQKMWESRPYSMNWERITPLKHGVYSPDGRDVWAEWISPSPKKQRRDSS